MHRRPNHPFRRLPHAGSRLAARGSRTVCSPGRCASLTDPIRSDPIRSHPIRIGRISPRRKADAFAFAFAFAILASCASWTRRIKKRMPETFPGIRS
ncbi:hypothetical protein [Lysobacter enzymogenes]|uniref:hypothetical protein n=1 Tax=Lysobacter enzymogenes TaxID=69 RepID=UPI001A7E1773|nr:hypothetical protein [Lysobacter enzymogenes]UZW62347.1 hypothetical protein BV903_008690 [Lysobacter enzymogenes]